MNLDFRFDLDLIAFANVAIITKIAKVTKSEIRDSLRRCLVFLLSC